MPKKVFKTRTLAQIGEIKLLEKICRRLSLRRDVITGPGDDCAVVGMAADKAHDYLLTSDGLVEQVHFQCDAQPELIGRKALGRVLSDIAAMGGEPLWALVDLVVPAGTPGKRIEGIYAGMTGLAKRSGVSIVGGDVSAGKELQMHVFCVGRVQKGKAILRSGARAGDVLFVTGLLGGSFAGKHLNFTPRLREGQWLAGGRWPSAMIDISDGLLRDLGHIAAASRAGARLALNAIPISAAARKSSGPNIALRHALADGEDYELLFSVPAAKAAAFAKAWKRKFGLSCSRIGVITRNARRLEALDSRGKIIKLDDRGYEHWR